MGTFYSDWSKAQVARQTPRTKLLRRQRRVTTVRPLKPDWLMTPQEPMPNQAQKDTTAYTRAKQRIYNWSASMKSQERPNSFAAERRLVCCLNLTQGDLAEAYRIEALILWQVFNGFPAGCLVSNLHRYTVFISPINEAFVYTLRSRASSSVEINIPRVKFIRSFQCFGSLCHSFHWILDCLDLRSEFVVFTADFNYNKPQIFSHGRRIKSIFSLSADYCL